MNKDYWQEIVSQLVDKTKAHWASHVLSSNMEIIEEISETIGKEKLIQNCLRCYGVDFSSQPYLDEVLAHFSVKELVNSYKQLKQKPIETAGALMWLLEDLDPTFNWGS